MLLVDRQQYVLLFVNNTHARRRMPHTRIILRINNKYAYYRTTLAHRPIVERTLSYGYSVWCVCVNRRNWFMKFYEIESTLL